MRGGILFLVCALTSLLAYSQYDSVKVGLDSYVWADTTKPINFDSLFALEPQIKLDHKFYKERYGETDLMYKITDNRGDGFDSLYGTRNMRPILHGVAYRGGANNYYHKTDKRKNQNPLPHDGMSGLCRDGFSKGVYLYRNNFEEYLTSLPTRNNTNEHLWTAQLSASSDR